MAILFTDLDGTLVDTMPTFFTIMQQSMEELGVDPPAVETLQQHTIDTTTAKISFDEAMVRYFPDTQTRTTFFVRVWERFREFTHTQSVLFPGIAETLHQLQARGWQIVCYTGRDQPTATLREELDTLGIGGYLTDVFSVHAYNGGSATANPKAQMLREVFKRYLGPDAWLVSDLPDDLLFTHGTEINGVGVLTGVGFKAVFDQLGMPWIESVAALPGYIRALGADDAPV